MTSVVVAPISVAMFPEGGGHLWVFLQWIRGLERNGCTVHWLECIEPRYQRVPTDAMVTSFLTTLRRLDLGDRVLVYQEREDGSVTFVNTDDSQGWKVLDDADVLLNFKYDAPEAVLDRFDRRALIDIDPGLLQFWWSQGQISVRHHDRYFTTAEHIGTERVPDCGIDWTIIRPVVDTASWRFADEPGRPTFTTVTNWFGEWLTDGADLLLDNSKRVQFLEMIDLPAHVSAPIELAVCLGENPDDEVDRTRLIAHGWLVRHSFEVSRDPFTYQQYVRASRGEFSCVKPSCLMFANAWISDRTLCYLASGRPAIVQHTGVSDFLPDAEGLFRFRTFGEAVSAFDAVEADYEHHRQAARELAVSEFDAADISRRVLDLVMG